MLVLPTTENSLSVGGGLLWHLVLLNQTLRVTLLFKTGGNLEISRNPTAILGEYVEWRMVGAVLEFEPKGQNDTPHPARHPHDKNKSAIALPGYELDQ